MADETAWLIEFTASPTTLYFTAEGSGAFDLFGADHTKAVRFARKQDAETVLRVLHSVRRRDEDGDFVRVMLGQDCYTVTEHMWCSTQETRADESPRFWAGEKVRSRCRNCDQDYSNHLHTDEASLCPAANR